MIENSNHVEQDGSSHPNLEERYTRTGGVLFRLQDLAGHNGRRLLEIYANDTIGRPRTQLYQRASTKKSKNVIESESVKTNVGRYVLVGSNYR